MSDLTSPSDPQTFEFTVPDHWPPELALAFAEMMEKTMHDGFPLVVPVRRGATPEQISQLFADAQTLVQKAGLAVDPRSG
jgi:hypothetical protein